MNVIITRWNEHENRNKDSQLIKHLYQYSDHAFEHRVLLPAPMNIRERKNLKAFFYCSHTPILNEKKSFKETIVI